MGNFNLYGENNFDEKSKSVDFRCGDFVCKTGGDYTFLGRIVTIFHKWNNPDAVRVVVEDSRGLLLIMNPKQIQLANSDANSNGG